MATLLSSRAAEAIKACIDYDIVWIIEQPQWHEDKPHMFGLDEFLDLRCEMGTGLYSAEFPQCMVGGE